MGMGKGEAEGYGMVRISASSFASRPNRSTRSQRNYAFYRYFLLVTMELLPTHSNIAKDTLETLRSLNEEIGAKERAPRLALLELDTKLKCADHALALSLDKWTESVQEYWAKWGSKGSIVSELGGLVEGDEAKETEIKAIFAGEKRVHVSYRIDTGWRTHADLVLLCSRV